MTYKKIGRKSKIYHFRVNNGTELGCRIMKYMELHRDSGMNDAIGMALDMWTRIFFANPEQRKSLIRFLEKDIIYDHRCVRLGLPSREGDNGWGQGIAFGRTQPAKEEIEIETESDNNGAGVTRQSIVRTLKAKLRN